jgi:hypothetical protein
VRKETWKMKSMWRSVVPLSLALGLGLVQVAPALAQAATQTIVYEDPLPPGFDDQVAPCAGETVHFTGTLLSRIQIATDANGIVHYVHILTPRNVIGIGQTSGLMYKGAGVHYHRGEFPHTGRLPAEPTTLTYLQNFFIIGQGPAHDLLVHILERATLYPDGRLTVYFVQGHVECH